jgi:lauroyl/myristoyl acyltransferase
MRADARGLRRVNVPVLERNVPFGLAPATLAQQTGAALLPVYPLAVGQGTFRIIVEPPLPLGGGRSGIEDAVAAHASVLERYVRAYPDQWRGWMDAAHHDAGVVEQAGPRPTTLPA